MNVHEAIQQAIEYLEGHPGEGENLASRLSLAWEVVQSQAPSVLLQDIKEGE